MQSDTVKSFTSPSQKHSEWNVLKIISRYVLTKINGDCSYHLTLLSQQRRTHYLSLKSFALLVKRNWTFCLTLLQKPRKHEIKDESVCGISWLALLQQTFPWTNLNWLAMLKLWTWALSSTCIHLSYRCNFAFLTENNKSMHIRMTENQSSNRDLNEIQCIFV